MLDPSFQLRRTLTVDTAPLDLAFVLHPFAAADRTRARHAEFFFLSGARFGFDCDNRRNHFARFFDYDRVTDANIFTFDFIFVVQRRATDRASADEYRLEYGDGR